ncbi:MAG TPA: hypothetical protein GXZ95_04175 [Mollicutes bacterium]|nr:hypothetical protein [Mollicutes bacterium]
MYNNYSSYPNYEIYKGYPDSNIKVPTTFDNNDRIIGGGFIAPFLLGGLTGAALSPYFYRPFYFYPPFFFPPYRRFLW